MASEWVVIIPAVTAAIAALGGGGKFIWDKVEARFNQIEAELEKCREREDLAQERRSVLMQVNELFWHALHMADPNNWALKRAKELMGEVKALDTDSRK